MQVVAYVAVLDRGPPPTAWLFTDRLVYSCVNILSAGNLRRASRKCSDGLMPWDFWLIFLFLGVVVPWRGYVQLKKLLALPAIDTKERLALYGWTIAFQWVITGLVAWRALARGLTAVELGLARNGGPRLLFASVAGAVALGGMASGGRR